MRYDLWFSHQGDGWMNHDRKSVRKVRVYWDNRRAEGVGKTGTIAFYRCGFCSKLTSNFSEGLRLNFGDRGGRSTSSRPPMGSTEMARVGMMRAFKTFLMM